MMVVLLIVGLASGIVVMSLPDPRGSLLAAAERFAARVRAAQDKAIFDARDVAISIDGAGYAFQQRSQAGWRPIEEPSFAAQNWPGGVRVSTGGQGRVILDVTGLADPLEVTLTRETERVAVTIGADGAVRVVR
jgi:general secretion pathway protein H